MLKKLKQYLLSCFILIMLFVVFLIVFGIWLDRTGSHSTDNSEPPPSKPVIQLYPDSVESASPAPTEPEPLPKDLKTLSGKEYKNFSVTSFNEKGIVILHDAGAVTVAYDDLPENIRIHFKEDEKQALEKEKQKWDELVQQQERNKQLDQKYEAVKNTHKGWSGQCRPLVTYIKDSMNDPDSFEHVRTAWIRPTRGEQKYMVEMTFRGKNQFNSPIIKKVSAIIDFSGNVIAVQEE